MQLIKNNEIVDDPWVLVGDEDPLPAMEGEAEGKFIFSYLRWEKEKGVLRGRNCCLGIRLLADQPPKLIEDHLDLFDVIALEFPAFKDGRAFSYARILRDRYNYKGEIRAVGEVLRDQWYFMARCGFDAFEVADDVDEKLWAQAMNDFSLPYQPSSDGRPTVFQRRRANPER